MSTPRSSLRSLWLPALALALAGFGMYRAGASGTAPPPQPPPPVVGLVDMEALMKGLSETTARNAEFMVINEGRQKELDAISQKAKTLQAELEVLKPDAKERRAKVAELFELRELGKNKQQIFQQLSALEEGDIIKNIYAKAQATIAKVAAKDGYSLVLLDDRKAKLRDQGSGKDISSDIMSKKVLYTAESLDITERIITEMNNEFSAPAPRTNNNK